MNKEDTIDRFRAAVDALVKKAEQLEPDILQRAPAPGEWTVTEIAAHTAEIFTYWAGQMERVHQQPGTKFGRTSADEGRIRFVEIHKHDPMEDLIRRIRAGEAEAVAAMTAFDEHEWTTVTGIHPTRGEMTAEQIGNDLLGRHAEEHLTQLDDTVSAVSSKAD
ncbi:MAG: maleylpyruvate isomerase N-terminal domain-containing protein [Chloroflexi bacterium]|nr:maleylpyruvate isomerase N-terminal domain-containing protein [Chloroflexota bacterium]